MGRYIGRALGTVYGACIWGRLLGVHWTGRPDRSPLHCRLMNTTGTAESWGISI